MRNDPDSPNYDPGYPPGFDFTIDNKNNKKLLTELKNFDNLIRSSIKERWRKGGA